MGPIDAACNETVEAEAQGVAKEDVAQVVAPHNETRDAYRNSPHSDEEARGKGEIEEPRKQPLQHPCSARVTCWVKRA